MNQHDNAQAIADRRTRDLPLPSPRNHCRVTGCGYPIGNGSPICKRHYAAIPSGLRIDIAKANTLEAEIAAWNAAFFAIDPSMEAKRAEVEALRAKAAEDAEVNQTIGQAIADRIRAHRDALPPVPERKVVVREVPDEPPPTFRASRPGAPWALVARAEEPSCEGGTGVVDTDTYRLGKYIAVTSAVLDRGLPSHRTLLVTELGKKAPKMTAMRGILRAFRVNADTCELSQTQNAVAVRWLP